MLSIEKVISDAATKVKDLQVLPIAETILFLLLAALAGTPEIFGRFEIIR